MSKKALIPLGIFCVLVIFLAIGLTRDPHEIPSPFIGKPPPTFTAPRLPPPQQQSPGKDILGKVWLLNVYASWCVACQQEHALLMKMSKRKEVPIIGLNYKDQRGDGLGWLARHGNPYDLSAFDFEGKVGIDYGVYGVPETFLIDKQGVIRYKQIGPITPESLEKTIMPLVKKLSA